MKRFVITFLAVVSFITVNANDSTYVRLSQEVISLKSENASLKGKLNSIESSLSALRTENAIQHDVFNKVSDSLKVQSNVNASNIKQTADQIGIDLKNQEETFNSSVSDINKSVSNKSILFICSLVILLIILISYILFAKKRSSNTDKSIKLLEDAQKSLESQSIKLDNQLIEILEKKMKNASESAPSNTEPDHSLPLKVADEIFRIQNNIDRMDSNDKNVGRLNKALERMKSSFTAYGYEIVDMRGQEYTDNMPFEARFIPDDSIEEGKRIISGMDRLMVRYNGKMIQAPILAVRQNV